MHALRVVALCTRYPGFRPASHGSTQNSFTQPEICTETPMHCGQRFIDSSKTNSEYFGKDVLIFDNSALSEILDRRNTHLNLRDTLKDNILFLILTFSLTKDIIATCCAV